MTRFPFARAALVSLTGLLFVAACGGSPEDKVARLRSMYSARLNGFLVQKPPAPEPDLAVEGEETAAAAVDEPMAPEGAEEAFAEPIETGPTTHDIMLDILIQHDSPERLPGITLDISMAGAGGEEKGAWKVWFDTAAVAKANVTQYTHVLEDVPYEEGDGFYVEVRHPVPPAERSQYREFAAGG